MGLKTEMVLMAVFIIFDPVLFIKRLMLNYVQFESVNSSHFRTLVSWCLAVGLGEKFRL